jgi:hypothetical protein
MGRGLAREDIVYSWMHDALDLRGVVSDREEERGLFLHVDEEGRHIGAALAAAGLHISTCDRSNVRQILVRDSCRGASAV